MTAQGTLPCEKQVDLLRPHNGVDQYQLQTPCSEVLKHTLPNDGMPMLQNPSHRQGGMGGWLAEPVQTTVEHIRDVITGETQ
ncbi:hypothetical protein WJX77_012420 [Trebouxia sp. C0004]